LLRNSIILSFGIAIGVLVAMLGSPIWQSAIMFAYEQDYQRLVYACDSAMREHWLATALTVDRPDSESISNLEMTEVALFDCQDYDLLQKRLIQFGLTDNELGIMRLRAIESGGGSLSEVVGVHEIRD